jgi:C1A family cysteine protease
MNLEKKILPLLTALVAFSCVILPSAEGTSTIIDCCLTDAKWILTAHNPAYVAYKSESSSGQVSLNMPPRVNLHPRPTRSQVPCIYSPSPMLENSGGFPSSYDLRTTGKVTPATVTECGACWASAAFGSLESFLSPYEIWDFSEDHMQLNNGLDYSVCGGGSNEFIAANYLAAWRGPVLQSDYTYNKESAPNPQVQKHVQQVLFLPERLTPLDNDWVKLAIMFYGGVYSSASQSFGSDLANYSYYNPTNQGNHAVTLVGWDDNFDQNKFYYDNPYDPGASKTPPGNGAFIAKNNQGADWMENGFYYISYYDSAIASSMAVFTAEPASNYNRIYQYDPLGVTDSISVNTNTTFTSYAANVYTAVAADKLTAVSFFDLAENHSDQSVSADYQIKIYLDPPAGSPIPAISGPVTAISTSLILPGYYTVKLPQQIPLKQGQKFSVVLSGHINTGSTAGQGTSVALERPGFGYSQAVANPGESYVSPDGLNWQDVTTVEAYDGKTNSWVPLEDTNVCIKAFTTPQLSIQIIQPDTNSLDLGWTIMNDDVEASYVKPVAQFYHKSEGVFQSIGGVLTGAYYLNASGEHVAMEEGWMQVPPGQSMTVYANSRITSEVDRLAYNIYGRDINRQPYLLWEIWKYINLYKTYLHLESTDPMNHENVNYPNLSVVTVTFDQEIQLGPSSHSISVMSSSESKMTYSSVNGNKLLILTGSPMMNYAYNGLEGTLWTVHLPSDSVMDKSGNPMDHDYTWSFTIFGEN